MQQNFHITKTDKLFAMILSIFGNRKPSDSHVRISEIGRKVMNDRYLSKKLVDAIIEGKAELERGEPITISDKDQDISVSLVNSKTEDNVPSR